jgi:hypothetical protein
MIIRITLIAFCGICFFTNDTYGQNQKNVDSLMSVLVHKTGGERYPPLYELVFEEALHRIQDVADPAARSYMDKIHKTSHHLASHLKFLFQKKNALPSFKI